MRPSAIVVYKATSVITAGSPFGFFMPLSKRIADAGNEFAARARIAVICPDHALEI